MEQFHSEHEFKIVKQKVQFGLTFSKEAYQTMLDAIWGYIGKQIFEHWCCKKISIKIIIDGEFNPEERIEKPNGDMPEM